MKEDFRLVCYHENIYEKNNRIEHWIEQYYLIDVKGKLEKDNWSYIEHDIDGVKKLNYMFANKEELEKIDLKPLSVKELIISGNFKDISHIISDQKNIKK